MFSRLHEVLGLVHSMVGVRPLDLTVKADFGFLGLVQGLGFCICN